MRVRTDRAAPQPRAGGQARHARRGFTLVENLAAISAFTIIFLAGAGGLGKLLMTQEQTYSRTVAASAAMLLADWHASRVAKQPAAAPNPSSGLIPNLIDPAQNNGKDNLLIDVTAFVKASTTLKFGGNQITPFPDIAATLPDTSKDTFYLFRSSTVEDWISGQTLDFSNRGQNTAPPDEYATLLIAISAPSATETDSRLSFREVSFWHGPSVMIKGLATSAQDLKVELLGRYTFPDVYTP